jgi:ABC-2 type transport system ATP-binding protein
MTTTATPVGLAVATRGLTKRFGSRTAVDHFDIAIPEGSVCGFVGPNGAGKTTTIRMLLGLIRPTEGTGMVLGEPLTNPAGYLPRVGALVEAPAFYPTLSGRANLLVLARLGGIDAGQVDPALERVGLAERSGDAFKRYSLGMKQRLGIAAALLGTPSLLVLDEPANGLDPAGIVEVRRLMRSFADEGITVFVSSHLLGEIEHICDHLLMIQQGKLAFQGAVDELFATQIAELLARSEQPEQAATLLALVEQAGHRARVAVEEPPGTLAIDADASWAADLNRLAAAAGITLVHLSERPRRLEEAFFALTGGANGDVGAGAPRGAL